MRVLVDVALSHAPCASAAAAIHGTRNVNDAHNKLCDKITIQDFTKYGRHLFTDPMSAECS